MTTSIDSKLPGDAPPPPPWGVRPVGPSPALARRLERRPGAEGEVAVVLGAGGAFGPDVIRALQLRGMAAVVGADLQLTYPVPDAVYRRLDVSDGPALRDFLCHVERTAHQAGLRVGPVFDLSTVQTSPNAAVDRDRLQRGKEALAQALCARSGDVRLFYMSTAEVYGAPEGAPYGEDHVKAPFNDYGREKWHEERVLLAAHGRPTRGGRLHVV
ncbi:MAG: NAD-dependent epimerase/dehydratase family protein, partial [Myxococcota bacterium]